MASAIRYESNGAQITTENETWGPILAALIKQTSIMQSSPPPMLELSHLLDTSNLVGFVAKYALGSPNADTVLRSLDDIMILTATIRREALEDPLLAAEEGILMHLLSLPPAELTTLDISSPCAEDEAQGDPPDRTFLLGWALLTDLKSQRTPSLFCSSSSSAYYNTVECSMIEILNVPYAARGSNYGELLVDLLFALHLNRQKLMAGGEGGGRSTMAMTRPFLPAYPLEASMGYWSKASQKGFENLVISTMLAEDGEGALRELHLSEEELKGRLLFLTTRLLDWPESLFETVYAQSASFIQEFRIKRIK